ncbi:MAG: ParA family protein [Candidatus Competibacteraceae bacterium]
MRVLVVAQNKGGVGKTTISRIACEYFARQGYRVLGLDFDSQCNFSRRFIVMDYNQSDPDGVCPGRHPSYVAEQADKWDGYSSTADIFTPNSIVVPYPSWVSGLDVLPGHGERLRGLESQTKDTTQRMAVMLGEFLDKVRDRYDVVIVDTSPSKGALTRCAMMTATHLLIPTLLEPQSAEGLVGMLTLWRTVNAKRKKPLEIIGILPNRVKRVGLHEGLLEGLKANAGTGRLMAPVALGDRVAFAEADHVQAKPRTVFDLAKSNAARNEAEAVGEFIKAKLFERI